MASLKNRKRAVQMLACFAGLTVAGMASLASAASLLVDYKPGPSDNTPEFVFNGPLGSPSFKAGAGSTGNGDGQLPTNLQTPGGLNAETPFLIPGVPGSSLNIPGNSTTFFDTTLTLSGFVANAPAVNLGAPGVGPFFQSLGNGSFQMFSTTGILLLSGNITTASFIAGSNGGGGGSGAEFNAGGVNYTGGLIFNALVAAGGTTTANGMSISMTSVLPQFAIDPADGYLADFTADGTGGFNVNNVPEPMSISFAALAGAGILARRRKA